MPEHHDEIFRWESEARLFTANPEEAAIYYEWLLRLRAGERPGQALAELGVVAVGGAVGSASGWIPQFRVDDVAASLGRVTPAAPLAPSFAAADEGTRFIVDPAGALLGVAPRAAHAERGRRSGFTFDLSVIDAPAAEQFYTALLGLRALRIVDDPYGMRLLSDGAAVVAGIVELHAVAGLNRVSAWILYFEVDSVEEHVARAVQSGSRVRIPPDTSPFNRYAVLEDPWGNLFGFSAFLPADRCSSLPVQVDGRIRTLAHELGREAGHEA